MSTRSNIIIQNEDGLVHSIYCHYDGYVEHNGKILLENYTSRDEVVRLISLGDIKSLKPTVEEMTESEDYQIYDDPFQTHKSLRAYMDQVDTLFIEFIYMWHVRKQKWLVSESKSVDVADGYYHTMFYHSRFTDLQVTEKDVCECGELVEDCPDAYAHITSGA
jgi:hypothetical protein